MMTRRLMVLAATLALVATPAVAHAEPSASPPCDYTLSLPHVVQVSGTDLVTATLAPAGCDRSTPFSSVVCLQLQGGEGPGQCAEGNGTLTAQVYYAPYQPGATYVSTGRGCANTGNPPQGVCQTSGPHTATL